MMRLRATLLTFCSSVFVLILVLVLFTNIIPSVYGNYADQRIALCGLLIVLVTAGLVGSLLPGAFRSSLGELLIFLPLFIVFFLGAFQFSKSPFSSIEPVFYTFFFAAFCQAGFWLHRTGFSSEIATFFVIVSVVACFFYGGTNINVYVFALNDQVARLDKAIPWGFINIRYWSHVATWLLLLFPVAVLAGPLRENRLWRFGVALTAAIWWWLIFLSSSRGSMVGLAVGALFAAVFFGRVATPWLKMSLRYLVYGVVAWVVLSLVIPSLILGEIELRSLSTDSSGRLPLWQEAFVMSVQNFPFGMGPQSWLTHDPITNAYKASARFGHPHNMYLMWAAEYGWVSVAALVIPGIVALRRLWSMRPLAKAENHSRGTVMVAFTASVVAALTHAGVSAVFMAPGSMLVGVLVLTLFWAVIQPDKVPQRLADLRAGFAQYIACLAITLVVAGAGTLWMSEVLRYHAAMIKDEAFSRESGIMADYPRFWIHGYYPRAPQLMPPITGS